MASFDVMPDVQLYQPVELDDALNLADRYAADGWILGGGQDTYGWLKDRAKHPRAMIDLNGIEALRGIHDFADGIEIGAATTLREIIRDKRINRDYRLLSDAAATVASPQIRNVGTLGGEPAIPLDHFPRVGILQRNAEPSKPQLVEPRRVLERRCHHRI